MLTKRSRVVAGSLTFLAFWGIVTLTSIARPVDKIKGRIVFVCGEALCSINADGTKLTRLLENKGEYYGLFSPRLSPDGSKIAFATGNSLTYIMNSDGTNVSPFPNQIRSFNVDFSFNGQSITYADDDYPKAGREIWTMNLDGSAKRNLTSNSQFNFDPVFSPDGHKIAFAGGKSYEKSEIYIMNVDGTEQVSLTHNDVIDEAPAFSPDGRKIAFTSLRDRHREIYLMNIDGSNPIRLTDTPNRYGSGRPTFSPSGNKIAFETSRNITYGAGKDIYIINTNGSGLTRLTKSSADERDPSWGS